jgi:hypothetical protein
VTEPAAVPYPEPYEWRNERDQLAEYAATSIIETLDHQQLEGTPNFAQGLATRANCA